MPDARQSMQEVGLKMSSKQPILVDFSNGVIATYRGQQILPDKPNLVWVFYTPFGKLKTLKLQEPVQKTAIVHVHNTRIDYEGVDPEIVFVLENSKGEKNVLDQLGKLIDESFKKMQVELDQKTIEAMTAKHRATVKSAESSKQIAQDKDIKGKDEERDRFSPFGYRPRYLDQFNQNRDED